MRIETSSGKIYKKDKFEDPYYRLFLSNVCLRESCFNCPSRGLHKRADITLSDFWGVEKVAPDLIDGGGLSLVLFHTEKGKNAFEAIKENCEGHAVDFDDAIKGNMSFYESYKRPESRDEFIKDFDTMGIDKLEWKYTLSAKAKVKKVLQKLHLGGIIKVLSLLLSRHAKSE